MYTGRSNRGGFVDAALAAGFVLAWSSGFIGATLGARAGSVLTLLMWRFVLATPVLAAFSCRRSGPKLTRGERVRQVVVGLLSQTVYLSGTVLAVGLGVSPGTAALVAALQPIAAAALAGPVLGEHTSPRQWLGLLVGLLGVVVVVGGQLEAATAPAWAYALPFAGMAALVAATLLERRGATHGSVAQALATQTATSAAVFTLVAVCLGDAIPPAKASFWIAVAWTIVLSTLGGYGLYWLNLRHRTVAQVSALLYLTPPVTLVWALAMFGQPITTGTIAGLVVCLAGVLLARHSPATVPASPRPAATGHRL